MRAGDLTSLVLTLVLSFLFTAGLSGLSFADTDPENLASDWWDEFQEPGDGFSESINDFIVDLRNTAASQPEATRQTLADLIDDIATSFERYDILVNLDSIPAEKPLTIPEELNLVELIDIAARYRDIILDIEIEKEEAEQVNTLISQTQNTLNSLRIDYFKNSDESSSKYREGLEIIQTRLDLATLQQEQRLSKPRQIENENYLRELKSQIEDAPSRLKAEETDEAWFLNELDSATSELARLEDESRELRLYKTSITETPQERAFAKLNDQKKISIKAESSIATLRQEGARLALQIVANTESRNDKASIDRVRDLTRNLDEAIDYAERMRQKWRRSTDAERKLVESQISRVSSMALEMGVILNQRLQQTEYTIQTLSSLREQIANGNILVAIGENIILNNEGIFVTTISKIQSSLGNVWSSVSAIANASLFTINDTPVTSLEILRVLIIFFIAWYVSKFVRHGLGRLSANSDASHRASLYIVGRLFHYAILTIGILIGLSSVGLDFTKLAIFVSALGVGLGFGLQAIFSNFVAGLIILFERSLKVGDFVELESGVTGEVKEVNIRSTLITTNDNIDILVPNSEFVNGRVINWTLREAFRRIRIPFGVAYGTDKDLVKKAALEAADKVPYTDKSQRKRLPQVWLVELGDSSLNFELVVWLIPDAVKRPSAVNAAYTWEIESMLRKHGIEIPFPQRDIHIRSNQTSQIS